MVDQRKSEEQITFKSYVLIDAMNMIACQLSGGCGGGGGAGAGPAGGGGNGGDGDDDGDDDNNDVVFVDKNNHLKFTTVCETPRTLLRGVAY